jgi:hypothetical protein
MATATAEKPTAPAVTPAAAPAAPAAPAKSAAQQRTETLADMKKRRMHIDRVDSLGIENLFEVMAYDDADAIDADAGKAGTCARLSNLYMRQKGALVKGRTRTVDEIEKVTGFKPVTKKVKYKKDDGSEGERVEWDETESEYFGRFKKAVLTKDFIHPSFNGTTEELFDASVIKFVEPLGPFPISAKEADRAASEKTPPKYALKNAESIFSDTDANGVKKKDPIATRLKKWAKTFTDEAVTFEAFDVVPGAGATETDVATIRTANLTRLAWAIKAREDAKALKEYA